MPKKEVDKIIDMWDGKSNNNSKNDDDNDDKGEGMVSISLENCCLFYLSFVSIYNTLEHFSSIHTGFGEPFCFTAKHFVQWKVFNEPKAAQMTLEAWEWVSSSKVALPWVSSLGVINDFPIKKVLKTVGFKM